MSTFTITLTRKELLAVINAVQTASDHNMERGLRLDDVGAADAAKRRYQRATDCTDLVNLLIKKSTQSNARSVPQPLGPMHGNNIVGD